MDDLTLSIVSVSENPTSAQCECVCECTCVHNNSINIMEISIVTTVLTCIQCKCQLPVLESELQLSVSSLCLSFPPSISLSPSSLSPFYTNTLTNKGLLNLLEI